MGKTEIWVLRVKCNKTLKGWGVLLGVLPGSTNDSTTLPDVYNGVHRIADEGAVEFLMDRIYPTARNIRKGDYPSPNRKAGGWGMRRTSFSKPINVHQFVGSAR